MVSTRDTIPAWNGLHQVEGAGCYTGAYSGPPQSHRIRQEEQVRGSEDDLPPVELNLSRPFAIPSCDYRQRLDGQDYTPDNVHVESVHRSERTGAVPQEDDEHPTKYVYRSATDVSSDVEMESSTVRASDHNSAEHQEVNIQSSVNPQPDSRYRRYKTPPSQTVSRIRRSSDVRVETTSPPDPSSAMNGQRANGVHVWKGEKQKTKITYNETAVAVGAENTFTGEPAEAAVGGQQSRHADEDWKRHQRRPPRHDGLLSRSCSDNSLAENQCETTAKYHGQYKQTGTHQEATPTSPAPPRDSGVDRASVTTVNTKVGAKTSNTNSIPGVRKAVRAIGTSMSRADRGVVMDDDNITVQCDSYTVVYKDTHAVYSKIRDFINKSLSDMKNDLQKVYDSKLESFRRSLDQTVKQETTKMRQSLSKAVRKPEDTHQYVIITPKTPDGEVFQIVTAADTEDVKKKCARFKNVEKLILKFDDTESFGVRHMREIFKENRMTLKAKNSFSFNGIDMKDLHSYLIGIFDATEDGEKKYRLSYVDSERSASPPSSANARSRKVSKKKKKESIKRTHNEEDTDHSVDDDDERVVEDDGGERPDVSVSNGDERRATTVRDDGDDQAGYDSSSSSSSSSSSEQDLRGTDDAVVSSSKRRSSDKLKRPRAETDVHVYRERQDRTEEAMDERPPSKKRRSHRE